eukprot:10657934-Alexandrium_andersonii.AAC.1
MSASLVGSEMCIRDRNQPPVWFPPRPPGHPAQRQRPSRPPRAGGLPVSYTHLTLPTICSV